MGKQAWIVAALAGICVAATAAQGTSAPEASAAQTSPAKSSAPNSSAAAFGVRESVEHIDISPDGSRVVYLSPGPGRATEVYVAGLADGVPKLVTRSSGNPERLAWCGFVSNDRLICRVVGMVNSAGLLIPFSRLLALDTDGKNVKQLGQSSSSYDARIRQYDGDILDWLPDEDGAVLMAREYVPETGKIGSRIVRREDGLAVDRIDVRSMKVTNVEVPTRNADAFISDGRGKVRIKSFQPVRPGTGMLVSRVDYHYRKSGSDAWLPFSTWQGERGAPNGAEMEPIAVDATTNSAYVLKNLEGRKALYRVKLDGSMATELVYKNDRVDVDGVVRIGRGARVIGATFAEDQRDVIYFDPEFAKLAAALRRAIPKLPLIKFVNSSRDNDKLLIFAGSDTDPGRYFVYDKAKRTLNETILVRPDLENVALAKVRPISYPAGDGTAIPAYLTLPPGKESAKGLPGVVLPHGGPSARDEWGFDWLAQFLAHEGYAVLQPNYRGSAGFGDAWLKTNGFKSWRTSIGDVTAAGRWLVAQGLDPARLAIVGWSYGGYAALQSAIVEPDLFKAVVAIAPVTDLGLVKTEAQDYTLADLVADEIGSGPHIREGSPLQNAERIKVPVLMFHGDMDVNVRIEQSRKMDSKLRSLGARSELIVYKGLEHDLDDSHARTDMLGKIVPFLSGAGAN